MPRVLTNTGYDIHYNLFTIIMMLMNLGLEIPRDANDPELEFDAT